MRRLLPFFGASAALLLPCFWQQRIQAGDLSSHIYNAWLAQLIERGEVSGIKIVPQTHNIFFDVVLSALLPVFGPGPAQRIAVSTAVLIFFWGAFSFLYSVRLGPRRPPWDWAPCLSMFAYGWVYHMGLFNFYISLGLCLAALAAGWRGTRAGAAIAAPLLILAYTAHVAPLVWALAVVTYVWVSRRILPRRRLLLGGTAFAGTLVLSVAVKTLYSGRWAPDQLLAFTGADQLWVFDSRYLPLAAAILTLWAVSFRRIVAGRGILRLALDYRFQICILTAACVVVVPGIVRLPASGQEESLLLGRMSLAIAVLVCAVAASAPLRRWPATAMPALACIFFSFVYTDESALNRVEDKIEQALAELPPRQRVVSALMDPNRRLFSLLHVIDRACVGHCFSYANYEASVGQFRIRAERANSVVVANFRESWAMQAGGYVVQSGDLPLYRVCLCDHGSRELCISALKAGDTLKPAWLHVTPRLWNEMRKVGS